MIEERYREFAGFAETGVEGIRRTGLRVLEMRERRVRLLMPLEGNVNHVGIMYAGSLFTLGEITGGVIHGASFDVNRFYPIVKEVFIRFLRPVQSDVTLEVELSEKEAERVEEEAREKGKADFSMELEIKNAKGEIVSLVQGTWQIRQVPEGMGPILPGNAT